jgi:AcrR family transcriptional regulator
MVRGKQSPPLDKAPGRGKYDRSKNKKVRAGEQRALLLEATAQVIAKEGFGGASIAAICEQAGMSRATFYMHFRDLRRAMLKLHDYAASFAYAYVAERLEGIEDPLERLSTGVSAFLGLIAEHGDMARVVFREIRAAGPEYETRREAEIERFAELLEEGAREAYRLGVASKEPDKVVIYALVAAVEAVAMRYVSRGEAHKAREAEPLMVDLVFRALR